MARKRLSAGERREQLVAVGRAAFGELGYEATSVEELADRAGVSKPVVYEHFGGKEGLYAVVVDREVQRLVGVIAGALDTKSARAAVDDTARAFLAYIEANPDGFRVLVRDAPSGQAGGFPTVITEVVSRAEDLLAEHLSRRGFTDDGRSTIYAHALTGMVAQVGTWWLEAQHPDRDEVATRLVDMIWHGLSNLPR